MKKHRSIALIAVLVVVLALAALYLARPPEPRYGGKGLTEWLRILDSESKPEAREEAARAVREIGTNAVPSLLYHLRSRKYKVRQQAARGFEVLGGRGKCAIPAILKMMSRSPTLTWRTKESVMREHALADALAAIGADAFRPVVDALTNSNSRLRWFAEETYRRFDFPATNLLSLPDYYQSPDPYVRAHAYVALRTAWRSKISTSDWYAAAIRGLVCGDAYISNECAMLLYFQGVSTPAAMAVLSKRTSLDRKAIEHLLAEEVVNEANESAINAYNSLRLLSPSPDEIVPVILRGLSSKDPRTSSRAHNLLSDFVTHRLTTDYTESALGIVRGSVATKRMAIVFTGHSFAEGGTLILSELARRRSKASFFLTGDFLQSSDFQGLVQLVVSGSHYLGPHSDKHLLYCSWDGTKGTLLEREEFRSDLEANLQKIERLGINRAELCYFLPPYEHYNHEIAAWTTELGMTLINFTPGTRSNADYTGEADKNFVSSQAIFDSIVQKEREDPHGLNGFILLLHLGSGPGRKDKFHYRFGELLDYLAGKGYEFVRVDELLEPKESP